MCQRLLAGAAFLCLGVYAGSVLFVGNQQGHARTGDNKKVLGQDKIIAFTFTKDPKPLRSVTFVTADPKNWKYWRDRRVVPARTITWQPLLNNKATVDKAVQTLTDLDYGGDPEPVVNIDEFGFDFGGQTDEKCARILEETKRKRPGLHLTVWQMRGPIPQVLAQTYRRVVDLVLLECYVGDPKDYWWILTQVQAARMHGLLDKTVIALGLGNGGRPGEVWANTKRELEQQIRFVRLVAPESPGIGFFAPGASPELFAAADELCSRLAKIPTDGSGLPQEVRDLHKTFSEAHDKPTLVCSPAWVEVNRSAEDPNINVKPATLRAYLLNLGDKDARDVKVRLRNRKEHGGKVVAEGIVPVVPKRYEAIAVLPITGENKEWKTWDMEIEAPGCEIMQFQLQEHLPRKKK